MASSSTKRRQGSQRSVPQPAAARRPVHELRLPGEQDEEFVLFMPFSPARRNNTIAWLAARSDGAEYGKLLAFRFPTETLPGPSQVESRID
jgi:uncharacterized membrane protein (UPF0182 family)